MSTVYVVDPERSARDDTASLAASVGLTARCYASADEYLERRAEWGPGCLILALESTLPRLRFLCLLRTPGDEAAFLTLVLKALPTTGIVTEAIFRGISVLSLPVHPQFLLAAIQGVCLRPLERDRGCDERLQAQRLLDELTPREREIFDLTIAGFSVSVRAELATPS